MINSLTRLVVAALVAAVAGCAGEEVWAPDDAVARASYTAPGPTRVSLITSINTQNNSGAHTALLIDGAERLLFDPAGSWYNPGIPERNDVLFGMSPGYMDLYIDFQANGIYEASVQTVEVSPQIARQISAAVQSYGAVPPALCARSVSSILSEIPGFESISPSLFPLNVRSQFSQIPGVVEDYFVGTTTNDADGSDAFLEAQLAAQ